MAPTASFRIIAFRLCRGFEALGRIFKDVLVVPNEQLDHTSLWRGFEHFSVQIVNGVPVGAKQVCQLENEKLVSSGRKMM